MIKELFRVKFSGFQLGERDLYKRGHKEA